jgi:hypothetical protein
MSVLLRCPSCRKKLKVREAFLGKKIKCPKCRHAFLAKANHRNGGPGVKDARRHSPERNGRKPVFQPSVETPLPALVNEDYDEFRPARAPKRLLAVAGSTKLLWFAIAANATFLLLALGSYIWLFV